MLEASEKARLALSGDTEATITIDFLLENIDLSVELTREEFEHIIQPQIVQMEKLLTDTL